MPETPVNEVSEAVMEGTIPFALGWGAVLTGVSVGVHLNNRKKEALAQAPAADEANAEEAK